MDGVVQALIDEQAEHVLVARAQREPHAFGDIYAHYFSRIYNYVRYRVRDAQTADDLTAQVFERALANLRTYRPAQGQFAPWLFGIARNTVSDHFRRPAWLPLEDADQQPDEQQAVEAIAAARDEHARLLAALAALSPRERDLLALKFTSGMKNTEIAALTGMSESNVAVTLFRAVGRLRVLLG